MEVRADDNRVFMAFSLLFAILAVLSTQRLGKVQLLAVVFAIILLAGPRRCLARNSLSLIQFLVRTFICFRLKLLKRIYMHLS